MKNLISYFTYTLVLVLSMSMSTQSNAQNTAATMNMSIASSSIMLNSTQARTSVLLMNPETKQTKPSSSMMFTYKAAEPKLKPVMVALTKSNRANLRLAYTFVNKTSPNSSNKPIRFSSLVLTVNF